MFKQRKQLALLIPILAAAFAADRPAAAQDTYITTNTTISTSEPGNVYVGYASQNDINTRTNGTSPTVSLVAGGSLTGLEVYNASTVNVTGGTFSYENAFDSSVVTISGGTVGTVQGNGGTVNVTGGTLAGLSAYTGSLNISGGTIGTNTSVVYTGFGAVTTISGGYLEHGFDTDEGGNVTISGGTFGSFPVAGVQVNLFNGAAGTFTIVGLVTATDIGRNGNGGEDYLLTGVLANGQSITGDVLYSAFGLSNVVFDQELFVPEPSQTVMVALGCLAGGCALRRRFRAA